MEVPKSAVRRDGEQDIVFVVKEKFRKGPSKLGFSNARWPDHNDIVRHDLIAKRAFHLLTAPSDLSVLGGVVLLFISFLVIVRLAVFAAKKLF